MQNAIKGDNIFGIGKGIDEFNIELIVLMCINEEARVVKID